MSDWDGIEEFVAVAKGGSFTRGAEMLGTSLTHVSRAVMALEQRLQVQLLHRTTRVVKLTDTGRTFLEHCLRLIEDRDDALAIITDRSEPQGQLRITCSMAMGEQVLAPIMRGFALQHPKISMVIDLTNRLVDLVGEGYDLAIRTGDLRDSRLISTRIASRAFITCAAPAYLDRNGTPQTVEDLAAHECLIGTSTSWHFKNGDEAIQMRPSGRFRCNSGHAVLEACLAGMGICQLPEFYVHRHVRSGALCPLLPGWQADEEPIWAVYPQRRHLSSKIRGALDHLKIEFPKAMQAIAGER